MNHSFRKIFHTISYLQYPLMLVAIFYAFRPYTNGFSSIWTDFNLVLIYAGLGITLSTLQDTSKVQNTLSKKVWANKKLSKFFLIFLTFFTFTIIGLGLYGMLSAHQGPFKNMSIGTLIFGIGMIGFLKIGIEMAENHGQDPS